MTVRQAIADANARFVEAFNRGDAAALAAFYTEDAILLPPNSPMGKGKQAVVAGYKDLIEMGARNFSLGSVEVDSDGDLAYHVGTYSFDMPVKDGTTETDTGKFVDIFKRQAVGSWKVHVTIFNSDNPPPGQ